MKHSIRMKYPLLFGLMFIGHFSFSQDESDINVYGIQPFMSIECKGGWESGCDDPQEQSFIADANHTYNFFSSISLHQSNFIRFNFDETNDKIVLKQRFIMAYGSRTSETEGVIFCDTTLSALKGKKNNAWFTYTKYYPLISDTNAFFILNELAPHSSSYKQPTLKHFDAKQVIAKDHAWLFETGTDEELRNNREVKLWPYAIELELTTTCKGKTTVWKFRFKIRHGEC